MKTALFTALFLFTNLAAQTAEVSFTLLSVCWDRPVIYRSNEPVDIRDEDFSEQILSINAIVRSPFGIYWGFGVMNSNVPKNMGNTPISATEIFYRESYLGGRVIAGFSQFIFEADASVGYLSGNQKWFRTAYAGLTIPIYKDIRINAGIETMFSEKMNNPYGMRIGVTAPIS